MNLDGLRQRVNKQRRVVRRTRGKRLLFESLENRRLLHAEHVNGGLATGLGEGEGGGDGEEKPTVRIEATDMLAREVGPDPGMFKLTCEGECTGLTVTLAVSGSATHSGPNADYWVKSNLGSGPFPSSVKFQAAGSLQFQINPIADSISGEGFENIIVSIVSQPQYSLGNPPAAEVKIEDAPVLPIVYVTAERNTVEGSSTTALWKVRRNTAGPALDVNVEIGNCPSPSTACATDYSLVGPGVRTVTFAAGSLIATASTFSPTIELKAVDDKLVESTEYVELRMMRPSRIKPAFKLSTMIPREAVEEGEVEEGEAVVMVARLRSFRFPVPQATKARRYRSK
jgi:hypothetical protein